MKHMIFTPPLPEKQISNFRMKKAQGALIQNRVNANSNDISLLLIRSANGNGSSHLLHALGNEYRKQGIRISFLHFRKTDALKDLTRYHMDDILKSRVVFIDHLETLFNNAEDWSETENFLKELANKNIKLFCTLSSDEERMMEALKVIPFSDKLEVIELHPLSQEERLAWSKELLGTKNMEIMPEELFGLNNSNGEFLKSIEPYILQMKRKKGTDHKFMQEFIGHLNQAKLAMRKMQLNAIELEIQKASAIRSERYEKAANFRVLEKQLEFQRIELWNQVKRMQDDLPFYPGLIDLHFRSISLLNELDKNNSALRILSKKLNSHLNQLETTLKDFRERGKENYCDPLTEELREWQYAVERFNTQRNNNQ